jgi:raffinose/stachyose/melibiose transport system substrate-binding protein
MNMFKSKIVKVLATSVVLSTLLAGCSGQEKASTSSTSKNEPVTLTMLIGETINTPGFQEVVKSIEKDLNIKTEVELRPGGPEGENIVKTRLATGDMADLSVFNSGSLLKTLNPEQNFVDLTNEPFMKNVFDSFKDTVTDNGKVFGAPVSSSQVGGWLYNKRVYKELGLSVPKTWEELMANNAKIKAAGKTAVIGSYNTNWTAQLIILADYYNVQAQEPNFAKDYTAGKAKYAKTPAALRGFEKLEEINKKGYMNKDFNTTTYDQAMKMLADGDGVQYPMLTQVLPVIADKYPDKINDIGVFPQPSDSADVNGFTVWLPNTILINKKTEKLDAAKKWVEYYVSEKGIAAYASKSKAIGPNVINGVKVADDAYPAVKEMLPYFDAGHVASALEFSTPVKGANLPQISTEVGGGITKALKGAQMYDKDVEKQAVQLGLPGWK